MPSGPSNPASKRKPTAFKPPRPASKAAKTATPRRKSAPARAPSFSSSSLEEQDSPKDIESLETVVPPATQDPPPTIPPKLLTKLLHHHFEGDKTRISKDANALVGKYMETFVREALARAAYERSEAEGGLGGHFLEVRKGKATTSEGDRTDEFATARLKILKSWRRSYC